MPRPNISGRAARARLAPFAIGSLGALSLLAPAASVATSAPAAAVTARAATSPPIGAPGAVAAPTIAAAGGAPALAAAADAAGSAPPPPPARDQSFAFAARPRRRLAFRLVRGDLNVLAGHAATVAGALLPGRAGHLVELQWRAGRRWRTLARAFTGARGRFHLRYAPRRLGKLRLRLLFPGDAGAGASARRLDPLGVFRLAGASWYGGGGSLACGGWLSSSTLGVANKTLPCGTLVTLRYGHRSIRVPVIDRGPYVAGRDFDLTEATKRALGFEGVGEVWSSR